MVSFFGLRFGGDKKKQQKQDVKRNRNTLGEGELAGHDLLQARESPSRPETSTSITATGRSNWRRTFTDIAAASSMIDLSSSQPSIGASLIADGEGLKPWAKPSASMMNLAMPPFGGDRPGTPGRSGQNPPASPAQLQSAQVQTPQDQLDNGTGHPSPPRSLRPSITSNGPNLASLAAGHAFGPAPLPSPVPSTLHAGDDGWEIPVIRNVKAKRDTLTFLSPRRTSFIMSIEEADKERHRPHPADFDSAEDRSRACGTLGMELMDSPVEMAAHPFARHEARPETAVSDGGPATHPVDDPRLRRHPGGLGGRAVSDSRAHALRQPLGPLTICTGMTQLVPSLPDRPLASPLASKAPMEGEFPVIGGLPRGRLPRRPSIGVGRDGADESLPLVMSEAGSTGAPCLSEAILPSLETSLSGGSGPARLFDLGVEIAPTSPISCDFTS